MIGAGPVGRLIARQLLAESADLEPIGFVDARTDHRKVAGLPLLGRPGELLEIAIRTEARAAILAAPELPGDQLAELIGRAWSAGLDLYWLPEPPEPPDRRGIWPGAVRELPLARLIGREPVAVSGERARSLVRGRRIMVTDATGALGGALATAVSALLPAELWAVDQGLGDDEDVRLLLADARPHLLIHAAEGGGTAELEQDPCMAVIANVLTTQRIVDAAVRNGVERMVLVSTDEAADPVSVLGATRRLAELVVLTATGGPTRFASVRLGSLLGAPGSLLSELAGRIPLGRTVTIAHPEVARHFMTMVEAVGLVLESAALAEEAELFVLETGAPVPVVELVHRYTEMLGLPEVTIRFAGLGPGERLTEKSFSDDEPRIPTAHPEIWASRPPPAPPGLRPLLAALYRSAEQGDEAQVRLLLRRMLPEYRPVRRPGRMVAPPEPDAVSGMLPDHESL